jgi:hypothetical protein
MPLPLLDACCEPRCKRRRGAQVDARNGDAAGAVNAERSLIKAAGAVPGARRECCVGLACGVEWPLLHAAAHSRPSTTERKTVVQTGGGPVHSGRLSSLLLCLLSAAFVVVAVAVGDLLRRDRLAGHHARSVCTPAYMRRNHPSITAFPLTGGCNCGAVQFEVAAPIPIGSYCQCKRCQRRSGAAASANARIPRRALSGSSLAKTDCACGSPM